MKKVIKAIGIVLGVFVLALVLLMATWFLRPNQARVNPDIVLETWAVTHDRLHNSNTDMISWQGKTYLAFVSSPFHFGNDDSILHVRRSGDLGKTWEEVNSFNPPDEDIRDPKFAVIDGRLFLYALKNTNFLAEPYLSVFAFSEDGLEWTDFKTVEGVNGWLFWRPKTMDGEIIYNAAYWWEHGESILLKSSDGIAWERVSTIYKGERNDETEIEFLPDGRLLATARLEYGQGEVVFGDPLGSTLIAVSAPPYTTWDVKLKSMVARLDGPYLFTYHDRVFAVGRYQPNPGREGPLTDQGSILSRKRTSLFEVREDGLAYLTDLPSAGDTAYVGLVIEGDAAYASYYTSPIEADYPWILGMLMPSEVRIAKIDLATMKALADQTQSR